MEQTGSQVGFYRLYERIGGGGFASVFVARDTRTNEMVAVKVLHAHLAQDAQFIARFRREAEAMQKMPPHPNIVRLREFGQQGNTYYLAMEYLEGKDLSQILAERRRLPVDEALSIATQIAQALDMANRYGLVHRDIKPGNVKITPQGVVKVMDFGIARATEGTKLTQSGMFMGTPDYMAPEIWEGKPADIRSDIYALGAMMYEMLTGASPFHSDTPAAIMRRHLMEQPRSMRAARADVPTNVESVIFKMLAKLPDVRYQTPVEVLAALRTKPNSIIATMATPESAMRMPPPPARQVQPRLSGVWVGIAVVAAFLLIVIIVVAVIAVAGQGGTKAAEVVATSTMRPQATLTPLVIIVTATHPPPTDTPTASATPRFTPTPEAGEERDVQGGPLVYVSAGEFTMGSSDGHENEKPVHTVYLDAFWIDKYEVTNTQYATCLNAGACKTPSQNNSYTRSSYFGNPQFNSYPVIYVSWNDAVAFCGWAQKRLPTEAEWEKAARGTDARTYPWGNTWDGGRVNFCDENCQLDWKGKNADDGYADTSPVGNYLNGASPYGAMDMAGNVWEWVADWYGSNYYKSSPKNNPKGPDSGDLRVLRGGAWYFTQDSVRATVRDHIYPGSAYNYVGFRCAQ